MADSTMNSYRPTLINNFEDKIPADMVINAMIVAMVAHISKSYSRTIYHVGSSMSNPMKISAPTNCICDYFTKHPLISQQGHPISTAHEFKILTSMSSFNRYVSIRYLLPLQGLKYANMICCRAFNAWYLDAERKLKIICRLAHLYKPYVLINIIYDDKNLKKLLCIVSESVNVENETFVFDAKSINWEDYFMNTHLPGW